MPFSDPARVPFAECQPELVRTLRLPPPKRSRPDERIVELVLQAFASGASAQRVEWRPPPRSAVAAIAHSAAGLRLAVAHTRMGACETGQENAGALRPLAERLQSERALDLPGRAYRLRFYPGLLPKLLRRYRDTVCGELAAWAARELPALAPRRRAYSFSVPVALPGGKRPRVAALVEVEERDERVPPVTGGNWAVGSWRRAGNWDTG
jgi:hypothetical protein